MKRYQARVKEESPSGWDLAIQDAKKRIARLQTVIETCEEKKAKGEPWPGSAGELNSPMELSSR